jgi:hypothetical protein
MLHEFWIAGTKFPRLNSLRRWLQSKTPRQTPLLGLKATRFKAAHPAAELGSSQFPCLYARCQHLNPHLQQEANEVNGPRLRHPIGTKPGVSTEIKIPPTYSVELQQKKDSCQFANPPSES